MKKIINFTLTVLIFIGTGYYLAGSYLRNSNSEFAQKFNRYNLLAKRSPKYMQIDYQDSEKEADGSFTYYADSYDRQGKWHEINFNSDDDLADGQYLKLDTKGNYVKDYHKINPNDLPYGVYRILQ